MKLNLVQPMLRGLEIHRKGAALSVREILDLRGRLEQDVQPAVGIPIYLDVPAAFRSLRSLINQNGCSVCGIKSILGLLADGCYALCGIGENIPEMVFGAVGVDNLKEIWGRHPVLLRIREGIPRNLRGICGCCVMKTACLGSCVAINYVREKDILASFWFCEKAAEEGLFPLTRLIPTQKSHRWSPQKKSSAPRGMMKTVPIVEALSGKTPVGEKVAVQGWVRSRRDSKAGFSFIHLHDGSCFDAIQVVAPKDLANYASDVMRLTAGCSLKATGALARSPAAGQAVELTAETVEVVGWVEDPETYPISPKKHTFEYLREVAHLRPRTNTFGAVARVRHCVSLAVHRFFHERGFYWVHTPIVTASDCEGAGAMFRVSTLDLANLPRTPDGRIDDSKDFFGKPSFLTVSGQLNVETYCLALSKVYTFGPTFRAEYSTTPRHLAEFWMIEPEIAFADLAADASLAEDFLKHIFTAVLAERADDMRFFAERVDKGCVTRLETFLKASFERMTYDDAVKALEKSGKPFQYPVSWGMDLQTEHERYLTEELVQRPVVVMDYPKTIKPFYMRVNDDGRTVAAMDVLVPGIGEIIGGSQREERLDVLDARLAESKLDKGSYGWYRDLRRYGTVPHAGFGLGLERTIQYATGMANIRDVIPFPRTPGNATF